ncbi:MAG: hypothetical protein IBX55_23845, partial [Methyloprofundus sp.]|nr:hypothetical protein [Methyloprofundus sp.]
VNYEDFCEQPGLVFEELKQKLAANGFMTDAQYNLQKRFHVTRKPVTDERIVSAYECFAFSER